MNQVYLIGNLGKDAIVSYTKQGAPITKLSVATSKKVKDKDIVQWHSVVSFGALAESIKNLKKGDKVFVSGEIQYSQYEKNGQKMFYTSVVAMDVFFPPEEAQKDYTKPEPAPIYQDDEQYPF